MIHHLTRGKVEKMERNEEKIRELELWKERENGKDPLEGEEIDQVGWRWGLGDRARKRNGLSVK